MSKPISFRQRLAKNTVASMAANVWTIVLAIGSLPIILHGLGAHAFGIWVFLQTFSATNGWLSIPATGLSVSVTRRVASSVTDPNPEPRRRSTGTALAAFAVAGVGFGLALGCLTPTILHRALDLDGVRGTSLRVLGIAFGLQLLAEHVSLGITSVVEGIQEVALARFVDTSRKTAMAVAAAVAAAVGGDLQDVAVVTSAAALAVTVGALVRLRHRGHLTIGRPDGAEMRSVLRYAGTVSALTGTGVLHRTMDRTIAGIAFGPSAVALVEIANQIQAGGNALLSASTYPVLSATPWLESAADHLRLRALFDRATRYSVLLTFPAVVLTIALAGPFVRVWVGRDYTEAIGLTQVAAVYVLLVSPLQAGSNLLQGSGQAGRVLRASGLSVLVNLVASVVLVQIVGLVGVFLGTIVSTITLVPLLSRAIGHSLGGSVALALRATIVAAVPPSAVAALGAGVVVWLGWADLITLLAGGTVGVVLATAATLRWVVRPDEHRELRAALRRQP